MAKIIAGGRWLFAASTATTSIGSFLAYLADASTTTDAGAMATGGTGAADFGAASAATPPNDNTVWQR